MAQNYYDEFVKLPLDKMAQKMEDMTFLYQETRVPKKHYKEKLSVAVEEMIEAGVKPNTIKPSEYQALELTYAKFAQIKKAKAMASDWLETFENIEKNGAFYTIESEGKDND